MRIAVIREDLGGPLFLADLEPTSQGIRHQGAGQNRYLQRPSVAAIGEYLSAQGLTASASDLIDATVPVSGPVDVSAAAIQAVSGLDTTSDAQVTAIQDLLAPRIVETSIAKASWSGGNLKGLRSSAFNPHPSATQGAAIVVITDDGTAPFSL